MGRRGELVLNLSKNVPAGSSVAAKAGGIPFEVSPPTRGRRFSFLKYL